MSYTTRSSNGVVYYQGDKDESRTADGKAVVNVRGDHGMTNDQIMYDGRQFTGKHGATRMAGDKMKSFQRDLDNARNRGDTKKVQEMRNTKRQHLQQAREDRYNRRNK